MFCMPCLQQCVHIPLIFNYLNKIRLWFQFQKNISKKSECVWLGLGKGPTTNEDDDDDEQFRWYLSQGIEGNLEAIKNAITLTLYHYNLYYSITFTQTNNKEKRILTENHNEQQGDSIKN